MELCRCTQVEVLHIQKTTAVLGSRHYSQRPDTVDQIVEPWLETLADAIEADLLEAAGVVAG